MILRVQARSGSWLLYGTFIVNIQIGKSKIVHFYEIKRFTCENIDILLWKWYKVVESIGNYVEERVVFADVIIFLFKNG